MNLGRIQGFDWDSGNWPKCGKHGVSKAEIETVFENKPEAYLDPDHSEFEQRYRAIGIGNSCRYILIAFTFRKINAEMFLRAMSLCHTVVVEKDLDKMDRISGSMSITSNTNAMAPTPRDAPAQVIV